MMSWLNDWLLTLLMAVPLVGAAVIGLRGTDDPGRARRLALAVSLVVLLLAVVALALCLSSWASPGGGEAGPSDRFLLSVRHPWLSGEATTIEAAYHLGVDGLSIWLVVLTGLLVPVVLTACGDRVTARPGVFFALVLLLEAGLLGAFCARDALLFYLCYELTLVPVYFIIAMWGGADRHRAAVTVFLYTLAGSVLTLGGLLYLAWAARHTPAVGRFTFDLQALVSAGQALPATTQGWVLLALAAGFAVKVPLVPLHSWLPRAYVEAPAAGAALLAGVVSKLGTYGFLRLVLPILPAASRDLAPLLAGLAVAGILYAGLIAWVQQDLRRLIAYSSVSHLGFCVLGLFSLHIAGLTGALLGMINHGLIVGALFLLVGMLHARFPGAGMADLAGLARRMPWLAFFLVFFTLCAVGLPGLNGFVGEFLVLIGAFSGAGAAGETPAGPLSPAFAVLAVAGVLIGAMYMLRMCEQVLFGPLRTPRDGPAEAADGRDLDRREIGCLIPVAALCLLLGLWPRPLIEVMQPGLQGILSAGSVQAVHARPDSPELPAMAAADVARRPAAGPSPEVPGAAPGPQEPVRGVAEALSPVTDLPDPPCPQFRAVGRWD